jgi:hypothetical protein
MDGETGNGPSINANPYLLGLTKPGSFILPIKKFRSFYMWCVENLLWIYKGQYVFFSGNVPHGGTTRKILPGSNDGREWHPAIHGHLDSIFHGRNAKQVNREQQFRHYFPPVHWPYVPRAVIVKHFREKAKEIGQLINFLVWSRMKTATWAFKELRSYIGYYNWGGYVLSTYIPDLTENDDSPGKERISESTSLPLKRQRNRTNRFTP